MLAVGHCGVRRLFPSSRKPQRLWRVSFVVCLVASLFPSVFNALEGRLRGEQIRFDQVSSGQVRDCIRFDQSRN